MPKPLLFVLLITLLLPGCQQAGEEKTHSTTILTAQTPEPLEGIMEFIAGQLALSDLKYSSLVTGIDSLNVYFGSMKQMGNPGYWISAAIRDSVMSWSTIGLLPNDSTAIISDNVDLDFDHGTKRVSLRLMLNPQSGQVVYSWLNKGKAGVQAQIMEIETPIRMNKPFPELEVNLLSGESLRIAGLKGKYVVIKWWHSYCGPCIAAMPGLNELKKKYENHPDVEFLAITMETRQRVEEFLKIRDFTFLHSLGNQESSAIFGESFPKYVIIDPEGIVIYLASGGSEKSYEAIDHSLSMTLKTRV